MLVNMINVSGMQNYAREDLIFNNLEDKYTNKVCTPVVILSLFQDTPIYKVFHKGNRNTRKERLFPKSKIIHNVKKFRKEKYAGEAKT